MDWLRKWLLNLHWQRLDKRLLLRNSLGRRRKIVERWLLEMCGREKWLLGLHDKGLLQRQFRRLRRALRKGLQ